VWATRQCASTWAIDTALTRQLRESWSVPVRGDQIVANVVRAAGIVPAYA
jgi:hypothetical protein